jgi:UDP-N-acetylglucosamine 2-epimerase (non-hydrolysing)
MKTIMIVFGTRPEAIKMCPLIIELRKHKSLKVIVCVTSQHKQMLQQVLDIFKIDPDYDLNVMKENQTLFDITTSILNKIREVLEIIKPDLVLVHGDTSTTFVTSLACFYKQIDVGHIEAGLRTYNLRSPFPEEFNRQAVSILAKYHFSPTKLSMENLIKEGKNRNSIYVTGNTAIDALKYTIQDNHKSALLNKLKNSKFIVLTLHRRENIGPPMDNILKAIVKLTKLYPKISFVIPMHKNPIVRDYFYRHLNNIDNIYLIEPLDVVDFHNLMKKSYFIMTDSGGIQEEGPALGKPVLVLRNTTERPEGVKAGTLKLVGTSTSKILNSVKELINNKVVFDKMSKAKNPYGDGNASKRITDIILKEFNLWKV